MLMVYVSRAPSRMYRKVALFADDYYVFGPFVSKVRIPQMVNVQSAAITRTTPVFALPATIYQCLRRECLPMWRLKIFLVKLSRKISFSVDARPPLLFRGRSFLRS